MEVADDARVPVVVITGFLGAGKTTLLNHILTAEHGRSYAVVVNEFGEAGIDGDLIESGDEELIELNSGCLCCVVRGDLIRSLRGLLKRRPGLDGIVIETTGVANPSPVIQTFAADQILARLARLDAVVTVVDAVNGPARLADSTDAGAQVALASVIVLNKVADADDPDAVEAALRALNPHAPILRADRGRVDPAEVIGTRAFSLDWVAAALDADGTDDAHDDHPGHDHVAANGISSVTLVSDQPLDGPAIERWIEDLVTVRGADILRMKGILSVAGEDRRVVLQSVNMMYEGDFGGAWPPGPRRSKLVFIGRHLDATALREQFEACRATVTA